LVKLEVLVNETEVTMVQGDGLIIATPTGSTAYSLSAGGSMMHPSVPGIILTPVCPHSLSFRPVVLPDSAVVTVKVPWSARSSRVMVAVDGKDRIELNRGDTIKVSVSQYPLPTITKRSVTDDWFRSVNGALQWNKRLEQKALTTTSSSGVAPSPVAPSPTNDIHRQTSA
jgi:NAD+ kinase